MERIEEFAKKVGEVITNSGLGFPDAIRKVAGEKSDIHTDFSIEVLRILVYKLKTRTGRDDIFPLERRLSMVLQSKGNEHQLASEGD